jgi:HemK-like putative methylase
MSLEFTMSLEQLMREYMKYGIAHEFRWIQEHAKNLNVSVDEQNKYLFDVLEKRKRGEPLAYIFGSWPFCGLELKVGPGVLIPRPETEELATEIANKILNPKFLSRLSKMTIVDFGAGSGCLGLGITELLSQHELSIPIELWLVEKSQQALPILNANVEWVRKKAKSNCEIKVFEGDWKAFVLPENIDVVVSNPPYIRPQEYLELDSSVKEFEPKSALVPQDEDPRGLSCYYEIMQLWKNSGVNQLPQILAFELGYQQDQDLLNSFATGFSNAQEYSLSIGEDMSGKKRYLWAEKRM